MIDFKVVSPWKKDFSLSPEAVENFLATINDPEIGFYHCSFQYYLEQTQNIKNQINRTIKKFIHIGLGGSSLGPEVLIKGLKKNNTEFIFLNNIDPVQIKDTLDNINLEETLFYIVSKSGTTAETMALFSVVTDFLLKKNISESDFKKYIVFCTDPEKGDLRSYAEKTSMHCLEVPSDIGGRFSVFTPVGFFPALFADIDLKKMIDGIEEFKKAFEENQFNNKWTQLSNEILYWYQEHQIDQTVLMPYSFPLKEISLWFVQLWAESLGKEGKGLTPLYAYGATDQHSQVQLFMEGPKNKALLFLEVEKQNTDFDLSSTIELSSLAKMKNLSMSTLLTAELRGTELALADQKRPFITFKLSEISESNIGQMLFYFQCLTAMVGINMNIDPFNQPGVEAGKKFAWKWIADLGSQTK